MRLATRENVAFLSGELVQLCCLTEELSSREETRHRVSLVHSSFLYHGSMVLE